jgi:hypothetical protein
VLNSITVQRLHRYAHIYIDTQQRFHGIYADKILIERGLTLSDGNCQADLFDTIAALRDLEVKINLSQHFQGNESARDDLTASSGFVVSTNKLKAFTFTPTLPNLEFGYVDQIPVAISRDINGSIEHYYFKF